MSSRPLLPAETPEATTVQRHTGLVTGTVALGVALLNFAVLTTHTGLDPVAAIISPFVSIILGMVPLLGWSAFGRAKVARPLQIAMFVVMGVGAAIDAEPGDLTGGLFLGFAYLLLLEYGYLNRFAVFKTFMIVGAFLVPYSLNTIVIRGLPPYTVLTTVFGAGCIIYIGMVLNRVRLMRHRSRERELEEAVRSRTATLEARMRESERLKRELERSLEEKELLLKEVHHRTKNNMQLISSVLNLENRRIKDPTAVAALTDGMHRVKALALAHEHLYGSDDLEHVDLETYTRALLIDIWESLATPTMRLEVSFDDSTSVDLDFAIPFGLILNELVSNTAKHAVHGRQASTVRVDVSLKNEKLKLTLKDDGPGLSGEIDLGSPKTMGIQLIVGLTQQLDGTVSVHNEDGTKWEIVFRLHHESSAA